MEILEAITMPEIGMGLTYGAGSDCYPGTITKILSDKSFMWTHDAHCADKTKDNSPGHQNWIITPRVNVPDSQMSYAKLNRKGQWVQAYRNEKGKLTVSGNVLHIGHRAYHYCWEF